MNSCMFLSRCIDRTRNSYVPGWDMQREGFDHSEPQGDRVATCACSLVRGSGSADRVRCHQATASDLPQRFSRLCIASEMSSTEDNTDFEQAAQGERISRPLWDGKTSTTVFIPSNGGT